MEPRGAKDGISRYFGQRPDDNARSPHQLSASNDCSSELMFE